MPRFGRCGGCELQATSKVAGPQWEVSHYTPGMTKSVFALAILLGAPCLSHAKPRLLQPSATTPTFKSAADGFSIYFPSKPMKSTREEELAGHKIPFHIVSAQANGMAFVVVSARTPANVKTSSASRQLDFTQQGFMAPAKGAGYSLLSRQELLLGAVPGRELLISAPSKPNQIRARLFFQAPMSYQVLAIVPKKATAAQRAQVVRVLDSFRIGTVGKAN